MASDWHLQTKRYWLNRKTANIMARGQKLEERRHINPEVTGSNPAQVSLSLLKPKLYKIHTYMEHLNIILNAWGILEDWWWLRRTPTEEFCCRGQSKSSLLCQKLTESLKWNKSIFQYLNMNVFYIYLRSLSKAGQLFFAEKKTHHRASHSTHCFCFLISDKFIIGGPTSTSVNTKCDNIAQVKH